MRIPRWRPDVAGGANFGDELGPLIVRAIRGFGKDPDSAGPVRRRGRLLSVGSVLHFGQPKDVVWGSGVNGKTRQRLDITLDVRAVRGPYTRAVLLGHGVETPEVYGDPALLLPRVCPEIAVGDCAGGELVVPNLNDLKETQLPGALDPRGDAIEITGRIARASFVIASSLHALIVADAFGIPSRPLRSALEHPFKYIDYYAGTGRHGVRFAASVEEARDLGPVAPPEFDADALLESFPHDLWQNASTNAKRARPQWQLRDASADALAEISRGVQREETVEEARSISRALAFVGDQDRLAMQTIMYSRGTGATAEAARALFWFLRKGSVDDLLDRRVMIAIGEGGHGQVPTRRDEVLWLLVGAREIHLARAIAREHAGLSEGVARASALGLLVEDEPTRSEAL
ncbi:polysaccharide pyruvyl transferase family protein [Microbacterium suaedae]|uniref:polysaccharide pyruvyl transferase family protein n=1 Tax=Microbacterium suaedae TaxID=2067813 RepID=UPI0013A63A55